MDQTAKPPTSTEKLAFRFSPSPARHPEENAQPSQIRRQPAGPTDRRTLTHPGLGFPLWLHASQDSPRRSGTMWELPQGPASASPCHVSRSWKCASSWAVATLGRSSNPQSRGEMSHHRSCSGSYGFALEMSIPEHATLHIYSISRSEAPTVCKRDLQGCREGGKGARAWKELAHRWTGSRMTEDVEGQNKIGVWPRIKREWLVSVGTP